MTDDTAGYQELTQRVFGRLAPFYDLIAVLVAPLRRRVVAFAAPPAGAAVLDVATGTGAQALAFARAGCTVVGIDLVDEMLAVARRKRDAERVRFARMDATRLEFAPASFDLVTISFGLHDMPRSVRERVLDEMVRVTRSAGRIVVVDYGLPQNPVWRWLALRVIGLWERGWYSEFVREDPVALLGRHGLVVDEQATSWLGAVRLLRARPSP